MKYIIRPPHPSLPPKEADHIQQLRLEVAKLYIAAYRRGDFDSRLLDLMNTGTFWCRPFLENPDFEAIAWTIGRQIHEIYYSVLDDGLGLPEQVVNEEEAADGDDGDDEEDEEDEDELVDVVEDSDDEDHLAPLRSALQQLDRSDDEDGSTDLATSISSSRSRINPTAKPKVVLEFVRRGTRFAHEEVEVPIFSSVLHKFGISYRDDIPIQLRSEDERFTFFLLCLDSDTSRIRALPSDKILIALSLRLVVPRLHARTEESNSKERIKGKWSKQEARAYLASFSGASAVTEDQAVSLVDRNVQLVSQVSVALATIQRLVQVLLLTHRVPSPVTRFSGKTCHAYLTGSMTIPSNALPASLWEASVEGLDEAFAEPLGKKKRKGKKTDQVNGFAKTVTPVNGRLGNGRKPVGSVGGMFGLLASVDA